MQVMHISDSHGYAAGTADALALAAHMGVPVVHTGDIVPDYFQQDIGYMDMARVWPVIGNHDAINASGTDPSGYHWHDKPTQAELRAKYFDPYQSRALVFPSANATWWHRDVAGCRIVGLDVTALGADLAEEITWLRNILTDMPALVLTHICPRNLPFAADGFTAAGYWDDPTLYDANTGSIYPGIAQLSEVVFAHAELTGAPTAMLCGHEHADGAVVHRGVPIISVGSIIQDRYNNVYRSTGKDTSRVVANLVTFDAYGLIVQRLGADGRTTGSRAKMWVYSYIDKRVTAIVSR